MAKHTCAVCGAEVGLISEQKLADGNFICRNSKKTLKYFDKVEATLDSVMPILNRWSSAQKCGIRFSYH